MISFSDYRSFFPSHMRELIEIMKKSGYECHFVGGCVRDFCMNIPAHDFDLTTNADSNEIISVMTKAGFSASLIGGNCGTVGIKTTAGIAEMTPYRAESGYSDHRHPSEVTFVKNLKEDLARRDFTMNALALTTDNHGNPAIFDPFDGIPDINSRIIRCVGEPMLRFDEDALRILRALRFSSRLSFVIEQSTANAIVKMSPSLSYISGERKRGELYELLSNPNAEEVIRAFPSVFEEFLGKIDYTHLDSAPPEFDKRLFYLLRNRTPQDIRGISENLKLSKNESKNLNGYKNVYDQIGGSDIISDKKFFSIVCQHGMFFAEYLKIFNAYEKHFAFFSNKNIPKSIAELDIDGKSIESLGFSGAQIGTMLQKLLYECVSGGLDNSNEALTDFAKKAEL